MRGIRVTIKQFDAIFPVMGSAYEAGTILDREAALDHAIKHYIDQIKNGKHTIENGTLTVTNDIGNVIVRIGDGDMRTDNEKFIEGD